MPAPGGQRAGRGGRPGPASPAGSTPGGPETGGSSHHQGPRPHPCPQESQPECTPSSLGTREWTAGRAAGARHRTEAGAGRRVLQPPTPAVGGHLGKAVSGAPHRWLPHCRGDSPGSAAPSAWDTAQSAASVPFSPGPALRGPRPQARAHHLGAEVAVAELPDEGELAGLGLAQQVLSDPLHGLQVVVQ